MNKLLNIIMYKGLDRGAADAILSACKMAMPSSSAEAEEGVDYLKELNGWDDASPMFDTAASNNVADTSVIGLSFAQDRSRGRGNLLNVQNPSIVPSSLMNNAGLRCGFRCPDSAQADCFVRLFGLPKELRPVVQALPDRHFYVLADGFDVPVLLRTPDMQLGPAPGKEIVDNIMNPFFAELDKHLILSPPLDDYVTPICYLEDDNASLTTGANTPDHHFPDNPDILAGYARFMNVIATNNNLSARELVATLGMSAGKITKIKNELARHDLISIRREPISTGRPRIIVQLTDAGRDFLGKWSTSI